MGAYTPYIHVGENDIEIIGEPEGLEALGQMLIAKAKLGSSLSATFNDGRNKPIKITSSDDLPYIGNND